MNIARRPIAIWFLIVFFLWSVGKDFQLLFTHRQSVDYLIFQSHGLVQLFYVLLAATFLLDFASSYYLFRPARAGFWVCLSAVALGLINNATSLYLSLSNLPAARDAYALSRELRGLPAREENLNRIFTPEGMLVTFVIASLFSVVAAVLIVWNRRYFLSVRATNEN